VIGERLVVEWRHLDPAVRVMRGAGFGEDRAGLDVRETRAPCARAQPSNVSNSATWRIGVCEMI